MLKDALLYGERLRMSLPSLTFNRSLCYPYASNISE